MTFRPKIKIQYLSKSKKQSKRWTHYSISNSSSQGYREGKGKCEKGAGKDERECDGSREKGESEQKLD